MRTTERASSVLGAGPIYITGRGTNNMEMTPAPYEEAQLHYDLLLLRYCFNLQLECNLLDANVCAYIEVCHPKQS